ncbi:MAG: MBL fold metallo-hydrolase, partial [Limisphaerales bacterium]
MTIRFWGVRGSVAVPGPGTVRYGGNTSCVEARWGRDIVILDAGTGIRELGKSLLGELTHHPGRVWILITHTHWDHIQGFPFFAPAYLANQQIRIVGWRGSRSGLQRTVATSVESPFFPVSLPQMPGTITIRELRTARFRIGRVRGTAGRIHHPGGGVAYRLDTPAGSLAYVPDHEVLCS